VKEQGNCRSRHEDCRNNATANKQNHDAQTREISGSAANLSLPIKSYILRPCSPPWVSLPLTEYLKKSIYDLITRTNLIHFTFTFIILKLKASTCFGHHLPILRKHYTNTVLVGVACCYRCRLFTGSADITARYTH
jgi:hypothetical protein